MISLCDKTGEFHITALNILTIKAADCTLTHIMETLTTETNLHTDTTMSQADRDTKTMVEVTITVLKTEVMTNISSTLTDQAPRTELIRFPALPIRDRVLHIKVMTLTSITIKPTSNLTEEVSLTTQDIATTTLDHISLEAETTQATGR